MKNIVLDLDGTLLRSDKTISQNTLLILRKLISFGKRIIIATARPPRGVYNLIPDELGSLEIIFYNGALVYKNKKPIFEDLIHIDVANTIKNVLENYHEKVVFGFEQDDWFYSNGSFEHHWSKAYYSEINFDSFIIKSPAKILVDLPNKEVMDYLEDNLPDECRMMVTDKKSLGQIMNKGVSKYDALLVLVQNADEVSHQTICFGDDNNDIDIIQKCAYSVAMENATEELRSSAKYTTKNNDQDGVATFLSDFFKIEMQ